MRAWELAPGRAAVRQRSGAKARRSLAQQRRYGFQLSRAQIVAQIWSFDRRAPSAWSVRRKRAGYRCGSRVRQFSIAVLSAAKFAGFPLRLVLQLTLRADI